MTPPFITAPLAAKHGFFSRHGGVSPGLFDSLNCGFSGSDNPEHIMRNRALVAAAMAVPPENLIGMKQVHGTQVVDLEEPWPAGQGPAADAIVTVKRGFAISVITADCAPVLFSDVAGTIIGAAHAGWRGAVAGVLEATIAAMRAKGADEVSAAIGPCIHQESYEVGDDLRDAVLAGNDAAARFFKTGNGIGKWQFDLPRYCAARLAAIGVPATILPHDTCADAARFFSHRRRTLQGEAALGHQISVIRL